MDINNNLQINTFTKGMDTDSSDMYIGEGSYRYAENLRVVTDEDSNSGELHIIEGTKKVFTIVPGQEDTDEYVDLGLPSGIKWATCNLEATNPYDSGLYYSWGNIDGHLEGDGYYFDTSSYGSNNGRFAYEDISSDTLYDAATNKKGFGWRIPTKDDFQELVEHTTVTMVDDYQGSGVSGGLFTSTNGNFIFLPIHGYRIGSGSIDLSHGYCWTSSYDSSSNGFAFLFSNSLPPRTVSFSRYYGMPIRPTYNKQYGDFAILGYTTIRNYIVVIIKRVVTTYGQREDQWAIFKYDANNNFAKTLVAGWFTKKIWPDDWDANERKTKPLSLVTRWESKNNVKLYIANEFTEILSINIIDENLGDDFDKIFQATNETLLPPTASISDSTGANIPGVVVQYGYIIYKKRGTASTLSILSKSIASGIDQITGFAAGEYSTNIIKVSVPNNVVGKTLRLYRICYSKAGQLPTVDIIYDQTCLQHVIDDTGQSLQRVSTAEFIATNKLSFTATTIESKGDCLFAGNVLYNQDLIDEQFKNFDARCYSSGSYYMNDGVKVQIDENTSDETLAAISTESIGHELFSNSNVLFDPSCWTEQSDGYNGRGLCFKWKYKYSQNILTASDGYQTQPSDKLTPRTYARNEVYRFGVKLYDCEGRSSSVKWIADIKMPDYFNPNGDATTMKSYIESYSGSGAYWTVNNLSIEFVPIPGERWNGVYKYEIVQAKRSIDDSYKLMQGLSGYTTICEFDDQNTTNLDTCLPYFLTTQNFYVQRGAAYNGNGSNIFWQFSNHDGWGFLYDHPHYAYGHDKQSLYFISPEYVYLPDDVKSLLDRYNTSILYHAIGIYGNKALETSESILAFNEFYAETENTYSTRNVCVILNTTSRSKDGLMDLQVGLSDFTGDYDGAYYLNLLIMNGFNYSRAGISYSTSRGPYDYNIRKTAFFTNFIAETIKSTPSNNSNPAFEYKDIKIESFSCFGPKTGEDAVKDEKSNMRSDFITLKSGKKFFNWTNPVLLDTDLYWIFTSDREDTAVGWKYQTMSSFNETGWASEKYRWIIERGHDAVDQSGVMGAMALSLPTGAGGSGIVFEIPNQNTRPFPATFGAANVDSLPPVTVANVYKQTTPYGGYNISAINSTQYVSEGFVESPQTSIDVLMGDSYITMFICMPYHNFDHSVCDMIPTCGILYVVPIESTMDLTKTCSDYIQITHEDNLPLPGTGVWVQEKTGSVNGRLTQTADQYLYNTAYSVKPDIITYSAEDTINAADSLYDSRIHYSLKKSNNELIDSWTSFKAIDYLDVDSRYGQITGLKLFKDKLIFLQENGAGVLSVNDRIILKDQESANIIVGNGGVLDRYDYFTTIYGMKPDQHAVEVSNDALYWWDGYRKEIIGYADGYNINLLQRIKNVANYINKGEESTTPSIVYDANNKEVLFNVVNNKCIVYNEQTLQFTAIYTFNPIYYSNVGGNIYLTDQWKTEEHLYAYNEDNTDGDGPKLFETIHKPTLKYIVNKEPTYNKVFDVLTFGGRFYGGSSIQTTNNNIKHLFPGEHNNNPLHVLTFTYNTPTKQESTTTGDKVTNYEYDYRLVIPRNGANVYGGRMRGKTMECTLKSSSNNKDFSIQYVTTKYRMSWT